MAKTVSNTPLTSQSNKVTTSNSDSVDCHDLDMISHHCIVTVNTPNAVVFDSSSDIANGTDTFTSVGHDLTTGLKGQFTTSVALPTGISLATDYFVIVIDEDNVKFATSLANAVAGTVVNITGNGTGNQTFTPTALAGCTLQHQVSNDNSNWADLGSTISVTETSDKIIVDDTVEYLYSRVQSTLTAGRISIDIQSAGKNRGN